MQKYYKNEGSTNVDHEVKALTAKMYTYACSCERSAVNHGHSRKVDLRTCYRYAVPRK